MNVSARQQGVVLVVTLIVLVLVTLIGTSGIKSGMLELRMAGNEEDRVLASQTAQAAVDAVSERTSNFPVTGVPGAVVKCLPGGGCGSGMDNLNSGNWVPSAADNVTVSRIFPREGNPPPMRGAEFSYGFQAAFFQIDAEHDSTNAKRGRAEVAQGYMILMPPSGK